MAMLGEKVKVVSGRHAGRVGVFVAARPFFDREKGKQTDKVIYCVALDSPGPGSGRNIWCVKIGPVTEDA